MRESLDQDEILERATCELGAVLDADHVTVRLVVDNQIGPAIQVWNAEGVLPMSDYARGLIVGSFAGMQRLVGARESLVVEDTAQHEFYDTPAGRRWREATGARAALMIMIVVENVARGVVTVLALERRRWRARAVRVGEAVAADLGRALENAQLYAAKSAAVEYLEQLDRSKSDFMSTVSHELRTPLTSISGYLELLEDDSSDGLTDDHRQLLSVVRRNTDRLKELIEDLLTLSRIESGAFRTSRADLDMADIVSKVVEDLAASAAAQQVRLSADLGSEHVRVSGDATQLSRALLNLINNAIKFTPKGGDVFVRMRMGPAVDGDKRRRVLLDIRDTGIGIPQADQDAPFTRFFRGSNATAENIPGTGLGLVIVQSIADNHGGTVRLDSVEGQGTTFTLDLPELDGSDVHPPGLLPRPRTVADEHRV